MTTYTSSQTGNWSSSSTWGGAGIPTSGDTCSIGAHTVTVDANTTVGTSPNDNTTNVVSLSSASSVLVIGTSITLTVKGNIGHVNGSSHTQNAGSTLTFDNSGSGGSPVYRFQNAGFTKFSFNGSVGSITTIQAIVGQTCTMAVAWSLFTATYALFKRISSMSIGSVSGNVNISDSTFDTCAKLDVACTSGTIDFTFLRNTFVSGTNATEDFKLTMSTARSSGTRRIYANIFPRQTTYVAKDFSITANYFGGGFVNLSSSTWSEFRLNFIKHDGSLNGGNGALMPGSFDRNYWVVDNGTGNPHFTAATALLSVDNTVSQNVFESHTPDLVDTGDCILVKDTATSGGFKVLGKNNIVLVSGYSGSTVSSGCLLTLYNGSSGVLCEWYRNTGNINNSAIASKRGMFAVAESGTGFAGQVAALKSNLAWGSSASQGYLGERVTGNVKDIITAASADKNWTYNLSAGDNQRSYEDKAASNTMWTAGDAVAASVDSNQGTGDPQFVDSARNIAAWAVARSLGSDYATGLTALSADPTRTSDLIDYVFEGFKVRNASMRTAAHDGGVTGAANYHKTTRTLTAANLLRTAANTRYGISI